MILRFSATSLTLISMVLFVRIAWSAEAPLKVYLLGDEKFTTAKGEPIPSLSTALFIEKTLDAASGTFTERAIQVSPSKKQVTDVTMTLTVKGQNFTIKDSLGTMTGTGTLQGPAWAWTFLSAHYVITANRMKIHDGRLYVSRSGTISRTARPTTARRMGRRKSCTRTHR